MSRKVLDLGNGRRVIHLALVVLAIAGIRACGGAAQAEDHLNTTTQWVAEKMGLERVKSVWATTVGASTTTTASKLSNAAFESVSRLLDALERTAGGVGTMTSDGIDRATAEARQKAEDRSRIEYVQRVYGVDGLDPALYHLMLDSTALPVDTCVELIVTAARARTGHPRPSPPI